jgi:hypothetical protein
VKSDFKYVSGGGFNHFKIPIHRGTFTDSGTYTVSIGGGRKAHYTDVVAGHFGRHGVTGTWTVTAVITDRTGAQVDRCGGDTKHWEATDK